MYCFVHFFLQPCLSLYVLKVYFKLFFLLLKARFLVNHKCDHYVSIQQLNISLVPETAVQFHWKVIVMATTSSFSCFLFFLMLLIELFGYFKVYN